MEMIDFDLPHGLIAQEPARPRDSARLLVYDRSTKLITDSTFKDIEEFLTPGTTVVMNNAKVDHCRWLFDGGKTEIFVLESVNDVTVRALVRPGRKFRVNHELKLSEGIRVVTTAIDDDGVRTLQLSVPLDDPQLVALQHVPLPPYIKQNDTLAAEYQTVYAKQTGSKAAPTAGLHFTTELLESIKQSHQLEEVTLHVGLGTFAPLKDANFASGTLHKESYEISSQVATELLDASHITAIGTTTVRTLESWTQTNELIGATDLFIQPGYPFRLVDSMITNFHLPGTSLLLMVEAFIGSMTEMQRVYDHAIAQNYRFYSFGDGMLIL